MRHRQTLVCAWLSFWFLLIYNGTNWIASLRPQSVGSLYFEWERHYPFVPQLIVAYWSMDVFYFLAPFFCRTPRALTQHLRRVTFGIAVAGLIFVAYPLTLAWPRPAVGGVLGKLFSSLEVANNFYNCLPSLHIVLRTTIWQVYAEVTAGWFRRLLGGWFFLITLSTLLCWQHYIVDVFTGQLLGWLCLHLYPTEDWPRPESNRAGKINADGRIARRYGLGSLLLLAAMTVRWPEGFLLLWPGLSLALVAAAYAGLGPSFLGKRPEGIPTPASGWLLLPYTWGAGLSAAWFNAGRRAYAELVPGLWVGRRLNRREARDMLSRGPTREISAVLDLTAEYAEVEDFRQLDYLNIPILDLTAPSLDQLRQAVAFLQQKPRCYLHCSLGRGRVAVVGLAFLLARGESLEEATRKVAAACPDFRLAPASLRVLEEFVAGLGTAPHEEVLTGVIIHSPAGG